MGSRNGRWRLGNGPHHLRAQQELIGALNADVDRQLAAAEAASAGITTRASILIAAAGLTSGLQVSSQLLIPAAFTLLAALAGVWLLLMRTAEEVPILEAEETFWALPPCSGASESIALEAPSAAGPGAVSTTPTNRSDRWLRIARGVDQLGALSQHHLRARGGR